MATGRKEAQNQQTERCILDQKVITGPLEQPSYGAFLRVSEYFKGECLFQGQYHCSSEFGLKS